MIEISVKADIAQAISGLDAAFAKQVPFAAALAITRTAKDIPPAMGREAARVFDRPRPFTTGAAAMYVKPATKRTLTAEVGYKDIQARYLKWEIAGGARVQKAFERALSSGGYLPAGYVTTPGAGIRLNAFGNIPLATLRQILGQIKSGASVFAGRGKRASRQGLFVVLPGASDPRVAHLSPGIWRRIERGPERAVAPLIHYTPATQYKPRLDLEKVARRTIEERFPSHFAAAWQQAVATAK